MSEHRSGQSTPTQSHLPSHAERFAAAERVSVPVCTYNGARYLREQLDSLLAQSYEPIEIVAVDDGSSDETQAILAEYAARHACMRVELNQTNLGFRRNFERALSLCTGRYIAPCDQDDIWLPDKITRLREMLGSQVMAYCDSMLVDAEGRPLGRRLSDDWLMRDIDDPLMFAMYNSVSGHAMLFKRELLDRALPIAEGFFHDWWLAAVAAASGGVVYCPEALVKYRQHAANVTDILGARKALHGAQSGQGRKRVEDIGHRIAALTALAESSERRLFDELQTLWRGREHQWVSMRLVMFLLLHSERVFGLKERSRLLQMQSAFKYFLGLRLKRAFKKRKYR